MGNKVTQARNGPATCQVAYSGALLVVVTVVAAAATGPNTRKRELHVDFLLAWRPVLAKISLSQSCVLSKYFHPSRTTHSSADREQGVTKGIGVPASPRLIHCWKISATETRDYNKESRSLVSVSVFNANLRAQYNI